MTLEGKTKIGAYCCKCGGNERYISNGKCAQCQRIRMIFHNAARRFLPKLDSFEKKMKGVWYG